VYAVVLGVALVLAVEQVIDLRDGGSPFRGRLILPFLAFVSLAFSIYHWGVTYLDRRYVERTGGLSRSGVFVDLLIGTSELLAVIGLSILISRPVVFAVGVSALLGFEVLAGLVLRTARNYERLGPFPNTYLWLNLISVALLVAVLLILGLTLEVVGDLAAGLAVLVVAVGRTAAFYASGFDVLFADDNPR
jgi:hypothetical protein